MIRDHYFLADVPKVQASPTPWKQPAYLGWVADRLPCVITLRRPVIIDHLIHHHDDGLRRRDDRLILPLVPELHDAQFDGAKHNAGDEAAWFARNGIGGPYTLAAMLFVCWTEGADVMRAMAAIMEARR